MKNFLSWIRWKFVIPAAIGAGLIFAFFLIFLDPLLTKALETLGAKLNGAKVDVVGLETKVFQGRLKIDNLQVADRQAPMTNRVEAGPLVFQLEPGQLIKKKIVIPDASIREIRFGTERKTSGYIPPREKKKSSEEEESVTSKLASKYQNRFKLQLDGIKSDVKGKVEIKPEDLEITRRGNALKEKSENLPKEWENKIKNQDFEGRLKKIGDDLEDLKNTPTDGAQALLALPKAIERLNQVKADLNKVKEDASQVRTDFKSEISNYKSDISRLKNAKDEDKQNLLSRLNLDFADPERLVEGVVGPVVLSRVQQTLHVIQLARKHLPSKKEKEALPPKPRASGMDIPFPRPADPPRLWIQSAALTGLYQDISVEGALAHLTSNPPKVGKPFTVALKGKKDGRLFSLDVIADHTTEIPKDTFVFEAKNIPVKKISGGGVFGEALSDGKSKASLTFMALGEKKIGGELTIGLTDLKLDRAVLFSKAGVAESAGEYANQLKASFLNKLASSIENMEETKVIAKIQGTWGDPEISITSNLEGQMKQVIKSTLGDAVKEQREEIERRLNALLKEKQGEAQASLDQAQGKIDAKIAEFEKKIQEEIQKSTGLNLKPAKGDASSLPVKLPDLKNIFK